MRTLLTGPLACALHAPCLLLTLCACQGGPILVTDGQGPLDGSAIAEAAAPPAGVAAQAPRPGADAPRRTLWREALHPEAEASPNPLLKRVRPEAIAAMAAAVRSRDPRSSLPRGEVSYVRRVMDDTIGAAGRPSFDDEVYAQEPGALCIAPLLVLKAAEMLVKGKTPRDMYRERLQKDREKEATQRFLEAR